MHLQVALIEGRQRHQEPHRVDRPRHGQLLVRLLRVPPVPCVQVHIWHYPYSEPNTNFQTFIVLFSLSYCIYDLLACVYYRLSDFSLISHHLFCILGFGFGAWSGYGAIDGIGGLFVAEVSNFYMHLRVVLRTFNRKNTKAYEYSENIYLGNFSILLF